MTREHWEKHAADWTTWARRPDFDSYWQYSETFFDLLPEAGTRTLDVGCGEGRLTRDLGARGHHVVGVDGSATLLRGALEADASGEFARCDAAALPFADETFDLVVFYNSLMDFDDMDRSLREAARVLEPGGRVCASTTHPIQDAGQFASTADDAPFVIEGTYLGGRRSFEAAVERDGLPMHFRGWAYPLEAYSRALENAGLAIEAIREPALSRPTPSLEPGALRWRRIPLFLMWRARKTG